MKKVYALCAAAAALVLGAACATLLGVEDFTDATSGAGASAAGGNTPTGIGGGGTGGSGNAAGGGGPLSVLWARSFGGPQEDRAAGVATAAQGTVVIAGNFSGSFDHGAGRQLVGMESIDGYVIMLDVDGQSVWGYPIVGTGEDNVAAIATDPSSNVLVVGWYQDTIQFETPDGGTDQESAVSGDDIFVVKLDPDGKLRWRRTYGDKPTSNESQRALGVATDLDGNVLLVGYFAGLVEIAHEMECNTGAGGNAHGPYDAYGAKLSSAGAEWWNQPFGLWGDQRAHDVAALSTSRFASVGRFGGRIGVTDATDDPDAYAITLRDQVPRVEGLLPYGPHDEQIAWGVAVDSSSGDVVVVGQFHGQIVLESNDDAGVSTVGQGTDMFVVKVDGDLHRVWSQSFGGLGADVAYDVAVAPTGEIAVTGAIRNDVQFGSLLLEGGSNDHDAFVLLLDPSGEVLSARRFGDDQDQGGRGIAFDSEGQVIVHGDFSGTMDFDGEVLTTSGDQDVFVAKLAL